MPNRKDPRDLGPGRQALDIETTVSPRPSGRTGAPRLTNPPGEATAHAKAPPLELPSTLVQAVFFLWRHTQKREKRIALATIGVVILLAYVWQHFVPEPTKIAWLSRVFAPSPGPQFFPGVEYQKATYNIKLNGKGGADWLVNLEYRRLRPETTLLADMIATSGAPPQVHSENVRRVELKEEPSADLPNLKRYLVLIDISKEPLNTIIKREVRYITPGGFDTPTREFGGALVLQPTQEVVVNLTFQPDRIGRNFEYFAVPWNGPMLRERVTNANEPIFSNDTRTLTWTIRNPKLNHAYTVQWEW
jgi:hypothetical protein